MGENYALELRDISKRFGSVQANDHVNLTLRKSEILAILGENGSGKTTLMNMIPIENFIPQQCWFDYFL